jgi:hypothetical protein
MNPLPALLQAAQQQTQANRYLFLRRIIDARIVQQAKAGKPS